MRVSKITYEIKNYIPYIHIYGRTKEGKRSEVIVSDFEPYFYIHQDEHIPTDPRIKRIETTDIRTWKGDPLKKVIVRIPANVRDIRDFFNRYYEADIPFVMRFKYDIGLKSGMKDLNGFALFKNIVPTDPDAEPIVWHLDIENDDKNGFVGPKYPTSEIYSITITIPADNEIHVFTTAKANEQNVTNNLSSTSFLAKNMSGGEYADAVDARIFVHVQSTEETLIAAFRDFYEKRTPDIITGWNVENFDIAYIKRRSEVKNYKKIDFNKVDIFDLWIAFMALWKSTHGEIEDNRLETVGKTVLGYGKIGRGTVSDLYAHDADKLVTYNIWDTILTYRIDARLKIIKFFQQIADDSGIFLSQTVHRDGINSTPIVDAMVLFETKDKMVLSNRIKSQEIEPKKGGFVHRPYNGRVKLVGVLDHGQEYPSIIRTLNLSFDTKLPKDYNGDCFVSLVGNKYRKDKRGIVPKILDRLSDERRKVKIEMKNYEKGTQKREELNMKQFSMKIIMNSFYGIINAKDGQSRIYDFDVAYDILSIARDHILYTKSELEKSGAEVIYMDTDSVLFTHKDFKSVEDVYNFSQDKAKELNKKYKEEYTVKFNATDSYLSVKLDKIYSVFFQYRWIEHGEEKGKKRYAVITVYDGKWLDKPMIEFTGFDLKRADTPELAKELQRKVLEMILEFKDTNDIKNLVISYFSKIKSERDKIGIPAKMGNLKYYKNMPIHVRAAQWSNDNIGTHISEGDRFYWVYGYIPGLEKTDVFAVELGQKFPDNAVINEDKMRDRIIRNKLEKIIFGLGYSWDEFIMGKKQLRLW